MIWRVLVTATALLAGAVPALLKAQAPARLTLAAASDLQSALPVVVATFERRTGAAVGVTYGASGSFFAQIQNGAPFDVFLSADVDYPKQLASASLGDAATLMVYASGHLAVWARREGGVDISRGLASLTDARIRHVAIANPKYAPYGRAAAAALRNAGIYRAVEGKLVMGESLAQTAQLVQSGNADAGVLSLSLALGAAMRVEGVHVAVPGTLHPPIDQAAIVLRASKQATLAREFVAHLTRADTGAQLARFGFTVPRPRS